MSTSLTSRRTVSAFRTLLRAVQDTFSGDGMALQKCRVEARKQFRANAGERDISRINRMVADAEDAAVFLRESVVQAKLNEQGHYAMKLKPQGAGPPASRIDVQTAGAAAERGVALKPGGEDEKGDCGTGCGCN